VRVAFSPLSRSCANSSLSVAVRHASSSDSDSDYGARAHKKKKKQRSSAEEVRVSSRGTKVPNYVDDVQDFEKFEEADEDSNGYYVDPNVQYQEEDEIEAVLGHSREEGREDDPEDIWFENVVSTYLLIHQAQFPIYYYS
jgi:chromodomain-helicase-DNA-binding protein 1